MVGATPAGKRNEGQEYYPLACSEAQDNVESCEAGALEYQGLQGILDFRGLEHSKIPSSELGVSSELYLFRDVGSETLSEE